MTKRLLKRNNHKQPMVSIKHRYTGVEYYPVANYTVNYKDVFVLEDFYKLLHEWFIDNDYATRADEKFPEKYFLQKESKGAKEIWIRWRLKRNATKKKTKPFWRFDVDVDIHVLAMKDVEVVVNNQKFGANKGEIEIQVAANLIADASGEWAKSPLLKPLRKWWFNKLMRAQRNLLEKQLYDEVYELRDAMTVFFKMEAFGAREAFWPKKVPE